MESSESGFGDLKRQLKKLVSSSISTGNGNVVFGRNGAFEVVDFSAEMQNHCLAFAKSRRQEIREENRGDQKRHDENLERKRADAEAKQSQSMRAKLIVAYKFHSLRKLTSRHEMSVALKSRAPARKGANVDKNQKEFLTSQYKAYCYAG